MATRERRYEAISVKSRQSRRKSVRPVTSVLLVVMAWACVGPQEIMADRLEREVGEKRMATLTEAAYERADTYIREWEVGSPLKHTQCQVISIPPVRRGEKEKHAAFCDGWVGPLSGNNPFGLGAPVGNGYAEDGAKLVFGVHVFGYVAHDSILVPRVIVNTQAQVIDKAEYEALKAKGENVGSRPVYIKDAKIREIVRLDGTAPEYSGPPLEQTYSTPAEIAELIHSMTTKDRYEKIKTKLEAIPLESDRWQVVQALGGQFVTLNQGEDYTLFMDGFLYMHGNDFYVLHDTSDGIFKVWPFGYTTADATIPELDLIFKNDKLFKVIPHVSREELAGHLK